MYKATPRTTLEDLHKKLGPEFRKQSEELQKLEQEIMKHIMNKVKIYLDDVRTPVDPSWIVVRNYEQFVDTVTYHGLENIELISLDHDLGDTAMQEWHRNVYHNYELNYDNIKEKTGMDCAKWLVEYCMNNNLPFPDYEVHSMNVIGKMNIKSYIESFKNTIK